MYAGCVPASSIQSTRAGNKERLAGTQPTDTASGFRLSLCIDEDTLLSASIARLKMASIATQCLHAIKFGQSCTRSLRCAKLTSAQQLYVPQWTMSGFLADTEA